jgi:hypothetical protein
MERIEFVKSGLMTSRIGLGTWAMGGWMWGGTDEAQSIATIENPIFRRGGQATIMAQREKRPTARRRKSAARGKARKNSKRREEEQRSG